MNTWKTNQRYREVLKVCLPLAVGMGATMVMEFTDRIFLANYSLDSIAAALPAGIIAFFFLAFFSGVGGYCSVFIAQYKGAGQPDMVGVVLWQGIYFSLGSGGCLLLIALFASAPLFALVGHSPEVRALEELYFSILCGGGIFHVAVMTLSSFFTGRGVTRPVMVINIVGMLINIPLDYCLINGIFFFPELGITGAAIATVASGGIMVLFLLLLIFTRAHLQEFQLLQTWRFSGELCRRLCRFGVPGASQFCLDILAFTFFTVLVGRISDVALATSNIVLSISSLAFMPAFGFNQGVSAMVGHALGQDKPNKACHATWSAIHILLLYTLVFNLVILVWPNLLLNLFLEPGLDAVTHAAIFDNGVVLLQIVAVYILFDNFYLIFTGALKGAGDTTFIFWTTLFGTVACMVLPVSVGVLYFGAGLAYVWSCLLFFIASLCLMSFLRFQQGRWRAIRVIE